MASLGSIPSDLECLEPETQTETRLSITIFLQQCVLELFEYVPLHGTAPLPCVSQFTAPSIERLFLELCHPASCIKMINPFPSLRTQPNLALKISCTAMTLSKKFSIHRQQSGERA